MLKRIQVFVMFLLCAVTAQASTWVYHDTLPTQVKVYVDVSTIKTVQTQPEIKQFEVSLGRSGEETETVTVQVLCVVKAIRTSSTVNFNATQSDKTMGKLVARVCNK